MIKTNTEAELGEYVGEIIVLPFVFISPFKSVLRFFEPCYLYFSLSSESDSTPLFNIGGHQCTGIRELSWNNGFNSKIMVHRDTKDIYLSIFSRYGHWIHTLYISYTSVIRPCASNARRPPSRLLGFFL